MLRDHLWEAKALVAKLRYRGDRPIRASSEDIQGLIGIRDNLYKDGLEISKKVTPALWERLESVCISLKIPPDATSAFVYASPEIQAECFSGGSSECVIRFSSALIELLDFDEFAFVAGHEIGHFLFEHGSNNLNKQSGLDNFLQLRAQEISADRVGLLACHSIDVAIRALMKTASGLGSRHLTFNIADFLGQLAKVSKSQFSVRADRTHPAILLRCRALLRLSSVEAFKAAMGSVAASDLTELDEWVREDLNSDADGIIRSKIQRCKKDYQLWATARQIVNSGTFCKAKQSKVAMAFGEEISSKLKIYLGSLSPDQASIEVEEKLLHSRSELFSLIPGACAVEANRLDDEVRALLSE